MELIKSLDEIKVNMQTMDGYLKRKCDPEFSYALDRLKKGICFITTKMEDGYHFYPSRFMGYAENTMTKHQNNITKDGRETNPVISKVLGQKPACNKELDSAYINYCKKMGLETYDRKRKYWKLY